MAPLCYRRHRFPPEIIQHAIWLYLRFTLSYRDVEELLAERGLDISYETVRDRSRKNLGQEVTACRFPRFACGVDMALSLRTSPTRSSRKRELRTDPVSHARRFWGEPDGQTCWFRCGDIGAPSGD
jgi:hypothetical protein